LNSKFEIFNKTKSMLNNRKTTSIIRPSFNNETESLSLIHYEKKEETQELKDSIVRPEKQDPFKIQMPSMNQVN
jgi:hypothetical protein